MARGGKRSGSGRKSGGRNKKTAKIAARATAAGKTPVEIMLEVMRRLYREKDFKAAARIAADAAPYCHPRLGAISHEHSGTLEVRQRIVEEVIEGPADS